MRIEEAPDFGFFTEVEIADLACHMHGIQQALLRVIGENPTMEEALIGVLLALGVSVRTERIGAMAPHPTRRIGVRYTGNTAVITLAATI